jgi:hypothetical protein
VKKKPPRRKHAPWHDSGRRRKAYIVYADTLSASIPSRLRLGLLLLQSHVKVVAVAYTLLAAVAVIGIDLRIVLIPTASASLALMIAGFIIFRRFSATIAIPWPAITDPGRQPPCLIIDGLALPFQGYDQELIVAVRTRRLAELAASGLLATTSLYVMFFSQPARGIPIGPFEAEIICLVGFVILMFALRWFAERRFLHKSRYAVGFLIGRDPGFFRAGVTYQFFDRRSERRGGHGPLRGTDDDNAVLVLFDPEDPDTNTSHGGFQFHRFDIVLIPARNRKTAHIPNPEPETQS